MTILSPIIEPGLLALIISDNDFLKVNNIVSWDEPEVSPEILAKPNTPTGKTTDLY